MKIYTLTGDDGSTSLSGGRRVPKHSLRVEAYGSVDELIAWIGLLRGMDELSSHKTQLIFIQDQLMRCAAGLSNDGTNANSKVILPEESALEFLEHEIDIMEKHIPPLRNFILPGGKAAVSNCHIARCVCRRAERAVSRLNEAEITPPVIIKFLNRLSDFLFVLSRLISYNSDNEEIIWSVR
jgi:cob(I)alamin adenosyltransferase